MDGWSAPSDRRKVVELIREAGDSGAVLYMARRELGISKRTYSHWKGTNDGYIYRRTTCERHELANKLGWEERKKISDIMNSEDFPRKHRVRLCRYWQTGENTLEARVHFTRCWKKKACWHTEGGPENRRNDWYRPTGQLHRTQCGCGTSHIWTVRSKGSITTCTWFQTSTAGR